MIKHFSTPRLIAERLTEKNASGFMVMESDPVVMKTLGGIQSDETIRKKILRNIEHWATHGFGLWLFHDKAGNFVGRGGLRHLQIEGADHIEIGYALMPDYWGQGLASEMVVKFIDIAREMNIKALIALTSPDNVASRRVMEKAGLRFERNCTHYDMPHVLYRLSLS